jgi:hypothetical protein
MADEVEEITEVKTRATTSDDIDELLSGYNQSLLISEDKAPETESNNSATPETSVSNTPTDWRNNPAYFQTGKKAGMLRPSMKHKAPMAEEGEISGTLIDGALFIMLIDLLVPMLITIANNKFTDDEIDIEDLQLSDKQKKDLSPLADEVVKRLSIQGHPVTMLFLGMAGIYGINYMAAKQNAK